MAPRCLVIAVLFALFPIGYILNLAFAGGNTLTSACPLDYQGLEAIRCIFPATWNWNTKLLGGAGQRAAARSPCGSRTP